MRSAGLEKLQVHHRFLLSVELRLFPGTSGNSWVLVQCEGM